MFMKQKNKVLSTVWDFVVITIAALFYAVGFNWFYKPNAIGFGGLTGVAQILKAIFPWMPIGVTVVVMNIPLFILGWRLFGDRLLISSLYAMAATSLSIDQILQYPEFYESLCQYLSNWYLFGSSETCSFDGDESFFEEAVGTTAVSTKK